MDLELNNLVALVTASSKGLGRATVLQLAREGAKVVICARGTEALDATRDEIAALGADVLALPADLATPDAAQRLVDATLERFGQLDILIANAGGPPPGGFLAFDGTAWEEAVQLTLMSFVQLCYAAIPALQNSDRGSILAFTSVSVKQPLPNLVLSNSLRLGVVGLVKSLADELAPLGIRVNAICPVRNAPGRRWRPRQPKSPRPSPWGAWRAPKNSPARQRFSSPRQRATSPA